MSTDLVNLPQGVIVKECGPEVQRDAVTGQLLPGSRLNPSGRPENKAVTESLKHYLQKNGSPYSADVIAKRALKIAVKGKDPVAIHAIQFVTEQTEGKPTQRVQLEQSLDPDTAQRLADIADRLCKASELAGK